ncbi:hypothetical protein PED39_03255 [Methanomassiliicoccales archaeon LGM-RCC1]|nr:hypothetical protein PED39_03255 [Methanomassiliicoccales archaeon LGM-RCC1]
MINLLDYTDGKKSIVERMKEVNVELTLSEIRKNTSKDQTLPPDTDELVRFYCYGTFEYVHYMLKRDDFDPDHVADICEYGLPYVLRLFLYN